MTDRGARMIASAILAGFGGWILVNSWAYLLSFDSLGDQFGRTDNAWGWLRKPIGILAAASGFLMLVTGCVLFVMDSIRTQRADRKES